MISINIDFIEKTKHDLISEIFGEIHEIKKSGSVKSINFKLKKTVDYCFDLYLSKGKVWMLINGFPPHYQVDFTSRRVIKWIGENNKILFSKFYAD